MAPKKLGKGIVKSGAMSSKASPLPEKPKEPAVPLTPTEYIQKELHRPGYKVSRLAVIILGSLSALLGLLGELGEIATESLKTLAAVCLGRDASFGTSLAPA